MIQWPSMGSRIISALVDWVVFEFMAALVQTYSMDLPRIRSEFSESPGLSSMTTDGAFGEL
jgi:hypothetical protein